MQIGTCSGTTATTAVFLVSKIQDQQKRVTTAAMPATPHASSSSMTTMLVGRGRAADAASGAELGPGGVGVPEA